MFGFRKFTPKKRLGGSIKARGTRTLKRMIIPGYGVKGTAWIKNPKKASYSYLYNKTTVGVEDLFKGSNSRKDSGKAIKKEVDLEKVFEEMKLKLLEFANISNDELDNLHKYIIDNDSTMISTIYYNVYKYLYKEKRYDDAICFLVCSMYMKVYEILPDDYTVDMKDEFEGINVFQRHFSKHIVELKKLWNLNNTDMSDFNELHNFFENIPKMLEINIPYYSENFFRKNKFAQKLNENLNIL